MRSWMVLLLITVAFAGCSDPEPTGLDAQQSDPASEPEKKEPAAPPEPPAPEPNTAPTAGLTIDVTSGEAPLNVTFTLTGDDADGDELTWSLDLDDDGTIDEQGDELPASIVHTYPVGNWTARFVVYDGEDEAEATVGVTVDEPEVEVEAGPFATVTATWMVGATDGPGLQDYLSCSAGPAAGLTHAFVALPEGSGGRTFTATFKPSVTVVALPVWGFYAMDADACDGADEEHYGESVTPIGDGITGSITGTLPATANSIFAYSIGGAMLELTLVID